MTHENQPKTKVVHLNAAEWEVALGAMYFQRKEQRAGVHSAILLAIMKKVAEQLKAQR